jgi:hypothetical protein
VNSIELPWETWRAIIDALRSKGLPYMRKHADHLEQRLDQYPPDAMVSLSLTDDVYLRSFNWARLELGLPRSGSRPFLREDGCVNRSEHRW